MRRQPVTRCVSFLVALSLASALVTGCTSTTLTPDTCPNEFTAAVVWTSRTARSSSIQFFNSDSLIAEIPIRVEQVDWTDNAPVYHDDKVGFLSTGDGWLQDGHLITMSLPTCVTTLTAINEPVTNITSSADGFITVGNLNGASYLHKFLDDGTGPINASFESQYITTAYGTNDFIYALSDNVISNQVSLIVIRNSDLSEVDRVPLPMLLSGETPVSMTVSHGKLVIPIPYSGNDEDNRLLIIDENDLSVHVLKLDASSPFYVRSVGDMVYVAHTFMNSAFRDLSQYHQVSVVNMVNEMVTIHDLPASLSRFDVNSTTVAILGPPNDDGTATLHTYSLPSFTSMANVNLTAPSDIPDAFAATIFLPQS